ncbi:MAG: DUF5678 domain-containing protein [Caldilineaceae bacterium]
MQKVILKEAQAPYQVALPDALLMGEVVILEKNGQSVAAVVPMAEYDAFQAWRAAQARKQQVEDEEAAIAREHQAFQQMLPALLQEYAGRVVALYHGEIIAVGDDRMDVWQRARQQTKGAPVYVQTVNYPPKVYKMPHRKVVRHVEV